MVYVDVLLTCHLFHIWVCVVGSMMKYFLNLCNTLEGMSVHFADIVYILCGDKHNHYFSHLLMELITSPVFMFNIFTSYQSFLCNVKSPLQLTPLSLLGHVCLTGVSVMPLHIHISQGARTQHSSVPFVLSINLVPKQIC